MNIFFYILLVLVVTYPKMNDIEFMKYIEHINNVRQIRQQGKKLNNFRLKCTLKKAK